jgi:hypothetical protein
MNACGQNGDESYGGHRHSDEIPKSKEGQLPGDTVMLCCLRHASTSPCAKFTAYLHKEKQCQVNQIECDDK